jgi:hypothetical protein
LVIRILARVALNKIRAAVPVGDNWEVMVHNTGVPDGPTVAELDSIGSLAALVSLPLMEDDIADLASSMRRLSAAAQPLLSSSFTCTPDPTLFDPRRW